MQPSPVTISQFEYLEAVLANPTWGEAAASVGVTPSALSQGIAELERRLGITLFDRHGRLRTPTSAAHQVAEFGARILGELRSLHRWTNEVRDGALGSISIGMIDTAALYHFGAVLAAFRQDHPKVALHLQVAPSNPLLDKVRSGTLDACVCVATETTTQLQVQALATEPLYIYAPPHTADNIIETPERWGPWISFPTGSRTRKLIEGSLRTLGARFDVATESSQPAVIAEMVRLGVGWTALPAVDAETGPTPLKRVRNKPLTVRELSLVTRRGHGQSAALTILLERLIEAAANADRSDRFDDHAS